MYHIVTANDIRLADNGTHIMVVFRDLDDRITVRTFSTDVEYSEITDALYELNNGARRIDLQHHVNTLRAAFNKTVQDVQALTEQEAHDKRMWKGDPNDR